MRMPAEEKGVMAVTRVDLKKKSGSLAKGPQGFGP